MSVVARAALAAFSAALSELPKNSHAWTYTIHGFDRADEDRWMHNHPWKTARFLILTGGYVEERLVSGRVTDRLLTPGDVNELDASTFHRVRTVWPNTWTLGLIGERVQEWGFLVDGAFVPHPTYFASKGYDTASNAPRLS